MTNAQWFAAALVTLDLCASIAYAAQGDARRAIYWGAAAVLTSAVTW